MENDCHVISRDDTQKHDIKQIDAPLIRKIEGVYLVDRGTPSRMRHLYNIVTVAKRVGSKLQWELEAKYSRAGNTHAPVEEVDRLIERNQS